MIPIYKIDPEYPRCIKKLSKKRRKPCKKNTGVLEYGKTGIIFKLPYDIWDDLEISWEFNHAVKGDDWNVIINPTKTHSEMMVVIDTPFYKAKDSTLENTSSCPDVIATETYKSLPEWIQERVEGIYVGDYEFLSNKFEKVGEVVQYGREFSSRVFRVFKSR